MTKAYAYKIGGVRPAFLSQIHTLEVDVYLTDIG